MREFGLVICGCSVFMLFFVNLVYPNVDVKGYPRTSSCTDLCYHDYVKLNGTVAEIIEKERAVASLDEFSEIKGLWSGCAACHGQEGQGMSVFPKLAGQSADYISNRLNSYRNRETVGGMSSTMWAQAGMLSDSDIKTLSKFIEVEL